MPSEIISLHDIFKEIQWGDAQGERVIWARDLNKWGKKICFMTKALCRARQKLVLDEASHEELYTGGRDKCVVV